MNIWLVQHNCIKIHFQWGFTLFIKQCCNITDQTINEGQEICNDLVKSGKNIELWNNAFNDVIRENIYSKFISFVYQLCHHLAILTLIMFYT